MFEQVIERECASASIQMRVAAQALAYTYARVDGSFHMALRAMSAHRTRALLQSLLLVEPLTTNEIYRRMLAMRNQFVKDAE